MKRIYITRHAKSSWADFTLKDSDRPLNKRGKRDAPLMAKLCKDKRYVPEVLISSDANRAYSTAKIFADTFYENRKYLSKESNLYHANSYIYYETCYGLDKEINSVMLFGHNPGITNLANEISNKLIDNVPTCGILVIDSSASKWNDVDPSNCILVETLFPKLDL